MLNPSQEEYNNHYESLKYKEIEYPSEEEFVAVVGNDARKSKLELILSSEEKYYIKRPSRIVQWRNNAIKSEIFS